MPPLISSWGHQARRFALQSNCQTERAGSYLKKVGTNIRNRWKWRVHHQLRRSRPWLRTVRVVTTWLRNATSTHQKRAPCLTFSWIVSSFLAWSFLRLPLFAERASRTELVEVFCAIGRAEKALGASITKLGARGGGIGASLTLSGAPFSAERSGLTNSRFRRGTSLSKETSWQINRKYLRRCNPGICYEARGLQEELARKACLAQMWLKCSL